MLDEDKAVTTVEIELVGVGVLEAATRLKRARFEDRAYNWDWDDDLDAVADDWGKSIAAGGQHHNTFVLNTIARTRAIQAEVWAAEGHDRIKVEARLTAWHDKLMAAIGQPVELAVADELVLRWGREEPAEASQEKSEHQA